jgi:hypothetical protein
LVRGSGRLFSSVTIPEIDLPILPLKAEVAEKIIKAKIASSFAIRVGFFLIRMLNIIVFHKKSH